MNKELLNRIISYKNICLKMKELGFFRIFSVNFSDALGISPVKVRKDFSILGIKGNYKGGYDIDYVIQRIDEILGKGEEEKVIVVGVGNLGSALINYKGFENVGIKIVAGFDIDPKKISAESTPPVYFIDDVKKFIEEQKVTIAILTVPAIAAQRVAEMLVSYGIKGILNFAPVKLKLKNCVVNDFHIESELEKLLYLVKFELKEQKKEKE